MKNVVQFKRKNGQKHKIVIFWYFTNRNNPSSKLSVKLKFGQVIENYISSEIFTQHFLLTGVSLKIMLFLSKIWPSLRNFGKILKENGKTPKILKLSIKRCVAIL